ncbi:hypothetical protein QNO07_04380 [Streptomyces sp. 549]|uniref:hypothetical protein n=1 Tax=Streptomyces sp. 549 TaxID=3049076 RepID=UPI0024C2BD93|nr:hypothetical protein [Streptomyces sp. 549]MDK1472668.1 hypothetical protein [Streptomyces sp. 549]
MNGEEDSASARHVRLQVELVLEVADPEQLGRAALDHIRGDELMPDEERGHATAAVTGDPAEALAYLVDPIDLVSAVPGVQLAQASWSSETVDYDPDAEQWQFEELDEPLDEDEPPGLGTASSAAPGPAGAARDRSADPAGGR